MCLPGITYNRLRPEMPHLIPQNLDEGPQRAERGVCRQRRAARCESTRRRTPPRHPKADYRRMFRDAIFDGGHEVGQAALGVEPCVRLSVAPATEIPDAEPLGEVTRATQARE